MKEVRSLTSLRWFAALFVFFFHVDMAHRTPLTWLPWRLQAIVQQGRLGVCVFFVLSGFVMVLAASRYLAQPADNFLSAHYIRDFYQRRFARIYPVYLTGLLLVAAISLRLSTLPSWPVILANLTLTTGYFTDTRLAWYAGGAHSLSTEFFFYLVTPLLLFWLSQRSRLALQGVAITAVAVGVGLGVINMLAPGRLSMDVPFAFPPFRLPEFVCGICTGLLVVRYNWKPAAWLAPVLLVMCAIYLSYAGPLVPAVTLLHNWIVVPTVAILLASLYHYESTPLYSWMQHRWLHSLGEISFCFYIAQLPLSQLLDALIAGKHVSQNNHWVTFVGLLLNIGVAMAMRKFIENPAYDWLMRKTKKPQRTQVAS
ncbi:Peptidoglycan/LPS O-acetylase OafA/YrhL, contains acyltransferase and SGNH-hydrolase domains [Hymenobacter gelipurpurascens]|uniref:Peptidoglycan/LPS O-acetylase OafA/YrhL, contains acyltransferase and SGNH-hydrolase domains n=1 Tax=Hymenobacter gelipurpurascens TaxID=89968 RepID=A0A212TNF9_9BACT|nr:acyltransferase [Hymenobacter gelipurpurascens]SNC67354.1 Peptidoglycan/LPS O-acetylase OafA/YrhL, contains acyltransferase and SGNH-hydrolase domains [Hymenobacter gelipurpurascens]